MKTQDTTEFIKRANIIHSNKYQYCNTSYVGANTKVSIECPQHGEFLQRPDSHLAGAGCPECARDNIRKSPRTQEQFIEKATEVHSGFYNYSRVSYADAHSKITIICPVHGEFRQSPSGHLSGKRCKRCANSGHGDTQETFLEKARQVHGDQYDYSKVIYQKSCIRVSIVCQTHGVFQQTPNTHIMGGGCERCSYEYRGKQQTKSQAQFIAQAKVIHGDRFDYSKVIYLRSQAKISIICKVHGEFRQTPNSHLGGRGCARCVGREVPANEVLESFNKVHKGAYDYSQSRYVNKGTKITIRCYQHGEFKQPPETHLLGRGCPKCGRQRTIESRKLPQDKFILKAKQVHGERYDYSQVVYTSSQANVAIVCPIHGVFSQSPANHLQKHGCKRCWVDRHAGTQRMSPKEFVLRARQKHLELYSYDHAVYVGAKRKVIITCPIHGDFNQIPSSHLGGQGCADCGKNNGHNKQRCTPDEFILKTRKIHGDKYTYDKVAYLNAYTKVTITCPKHGDFSQSPTHHIGGAGCNICCDSRGERFIWLLLTNLGVEFSSQYRPQGCRNKKPLPFDFALLNNGVPKAFIEFHGEQHYLPVKFSKKVSDKKAVEGLEVRKKRDAIKVAYCADNNISLLVIPYWDEANIKPLVIKFVNSLPIPKI